MTKLSIRSIVQDNITIYTLYFYYIFHCFEGTSLSLQQCYLQLEDGDCC